MGFLPHKYGTLLCGAMIVNLFMVMAGDVNLMALPGGRSVALIRRFAVLRQLSVYFSWRQDSAWSPRVPDCTANVRLLLLRIDSGTSGRFLGSRWIYVGNGSEGVFCSKIFPIAYIFLKEQRIAQQRSSVVFQNGCQQLKTIIRSKNL